MESDRKGKSFTVFLQKKFKMDHLTAKDAEIRKEIIFFCLETRHLNRRAKNGLHLIYTYHFPPKDKFLADLRILCG